MSVPSPFTESTPPPPERILVLDTTEYAFVVTVDPKGGASVLGNVPRQMVGRYLRMIADHFDPPPPGPTPAAPAPDPKV